MEKPSVFRLSWTEIERSLVESWVLTGLHSMDSLLLQMPHPSPCPISCYPLRTGWLAPAPGKFRWISYACWPRQNAGQVWTLEEGNPPFRAMCICAPSACAASGG